MFWVVHEKNLVSGIFFSVRNTGRPIPQFHIFGEHTRVGLSFRSGERGQLHRCNRFLLDFKNDNNYLEVFMKTRSTTLVALALGSSLVGCAQKTITPTSFSPQYRSELDLQEVPKVNRCTSLSGVDVTNGLANNLVGKRTLESSPVPAQNISLKGNPSPWVHAASNAMLKLSGINPSDPKGPRMKLSLSDIAINENVHVNSGYDARVTLDTTLTDQHGKTCWSQSQSGTSKNYGDSGSAINYQETINHALDRAIMAIVADKSFQDAACGACRD